MELQRELTDLRRAILTMAGVVEERVQQVSQGLIDSRFDLAERVRHGDREIDEMDVDIEAECLRILALLHPVATDLRFVLAVMRINTDLERVGDEAKSIAKRVLDLKVATPIEMPDALYKMATAAGRMLSDALTALAQEDADLGRRVKRADQQVDDLQKEIFAWIQEEIPQHVESTRAALDVLSIARRLERIGDLATNIAEDVIFLTEGALVRHERLRKTAPGTSVSPG
ncbi:MAG: phosphate signaling complex protein PhoU [Planctomycetota bacterium]|jgi:phosphate transport system protein